MGDRTANFNYSGSFQINIQIFTIYELMLTTGSKAFFSDSYTQRCCENDPFPKYCHKYLKFSFCSSIISLPSLDVW